jgi:SAM-dependent methyltransferase
MQWKRFRATQLDSHSGVPITRDRFVAQTAFAPDLRGMRVLDAGCGSGRFAEIALSLGADLTALDLSSAVDACRDNLGEASTLSLMQADLFQIPLGLQSFDVVYCFGVLQHTPDPRDAFRALTEHVKPGGWLAVDVYRIPMYPLGLFAPKYLLRPLTRRMPPERLFDMVKRWMPGLLAVSNAIDRVPAVGHFVRKALPISNYRGVYPLSEEQIHEWAVLDTFDQLSPRYDKPQTEAAVRGWFDPDTFTDVRVFEHGHIIAWGKVRESATSGPASPAR